MQEGANGDQRRLRPLVVRKKCVRGRVLRQWARGGAQPRWTDGRAIPFALQSRTGAPRGNTKERERDFCDRERTSEGGITSRVSTVGQIIHQKKKIALHIQDSRLFLLLQLRGKGNQPQGEEKKRGNIQMDFL